MGADLHQQLLSFLDSNNATYRVLEHPPEGRTEIVSTYRAHDTSAAAKCIVLMVKLGKKTTRYVLAVVPGDRRVNLEAVKSLLGGTYVSFASQETAERLAGAVSGTILPFTFNEALELIADPGVLAHPEIFFNAARLDRSLALRTSDYAELAKPRFASISLDMQ